MLPFKDFVNSARRISRNIRGAIAENINEKINETIELADNILSGERSLQRVPIRLEEDEVNSPFQRRDGSSRQFSTFGRFSSSNARIREFSGHAWKEHCKEQRQKGQRKRQQTKSKYNNFNGYQKRYYSYSSYSYSKTYFSPNKCTHKRGVTFAVRTLVLQTDPFTLCCHSRKAPRGLYSHFGSLRVRMFSTSDFVGRYKSVNILETMMNTEMLAKYASAPCFPCHRLRRSLPMETTPAEEAVHDVPGCMVEFCIDQTIPVTTGMLDGDTIRALKSAYVSGPDLMFQEMDVLKEKLGSPPLETYRTSSGCIVFCMKFPDCDATKMEAILRENSITTAVVKSIDDSYSTDSDYMTAYEITEDILSSTPEPSSEMSSPFSSYCGVDMSDVTDVSDIDGSSRRSSISSSSVRSSELDIFDVLSSAASEMAAFNHLTINSVLSEGTFTNTSDDDLLHLDFNEAVSFN